MAANKSTWMGAHYDHLGYGGDHSKPFRRFHAHGLIAKVPRTRRWRVTLYGHRVMGASLYLRDHHFPEAYSRIAA